MSVKIEIWSDFACPYCYIGERFLASALKNLGNRVEVELVYRAFELDPSARKTETPTTALLRIAQKYGISETQAQKFVDRVENMGKEAGLDMKYATSLKCNTFDAHCLMKLAEKTGMQAKLNELLFAAYFTENLLISDRNVLVDLAGRVGIDANEARDILDSNLYEKEVRLDELNAQKLAVNSVPFFYLDGKKGLVGAVSAQEWVDVLTSHIQPVVEAVSCSDDTCTINPSK